MGYGVLAFVLVGIDRQNESSSSAFEQAVLARAHRIAVTSPPYLEASEPLRAWADKCAVVPPSTSLRDTVIAMTKFPLGAG